jgi:serine/threonine-protein kinase RIO1
MPTNYELPSRPPPPDLEWLDEFVCEGLIVEVLGRLKSGKEATVFVCRGGVASHAGLVAAK